MNQAGQSHSGDEWISANCDQEFLADSFWISKTDKTLNALTLS